MTAAHLLAEVQRLTLRYCLAAGLESENPAAVSLEPV